MTLLRERLYDVRKVIRKAEGDLTRLKNELRSLKQQTKDSDELTFGAMNWPRGRSWSQRRDRGKS